MAAIGLFLRKFGVRLLSTAFTIYLVFFVKFGNRNLFQHGMRIARTPEARELGSEIIAKVDSAKTVVTKKIGSAIGSANPDDL
jgi:hypothetical protein